MQARISNRMASATMIAVAAVLTGSGIWQCPIHALTGYYCPGCGGTRALSALGRGDVAAAVHQNALVFVVIPVFIASLAMKRNNTEAFITRHRATIITAAAVLATGFTFARNTFALGLAPF